MTKFLGAEDDPSALRESGLSIIVVTYRSAALIADCVAALRAAAPAVPAELIIIDNDSGDDTAEVARSCAPDARVFDSGRNGGFAAGCHAGAVEAWGRWLLFVNPDALPGAGSIDALLDCARAETGTGIIGGRCLTSDGVTDPRSWWGRPTLWSTVCFALLLSSVFPGSPVFDPESPRPWSPEGTEIRTVPVVPGTFVLISREVWDATGGFDQRFFIYGEDVNLCLRAAAQGYRSVVTGRATFQHSGGASSTSVRKLIMLFTGKATVLRRHLPPGRRALGVRLLALGALLRATLSRLLSARPQRQGRPTARGEDWRGLWSARREWMDGWP